MLHSDWESELKQIMSGGGKPIHPSLRLPALTHLIDQEEGNITYMMFSATFPKICRDLAKEHLAHEHVRIRVGRAGSSHSNIKQVNLTPLFFPFSSCLLGNFSRMLSLLRPIRSDKLSRIFSCPPPLAAPSSLSIQSVGLMRLMIIYSTRDFLALPSTLIAPNASVKMPCVLSAMESAPS